MRFLKLCIRFDNDQYVIKFENTLNQRHTFFIQLFLCIFEPKFPLLKVTKKSSFKRPF